MNKILFICFIACAGCAPDAKETAFTGESVAIGGLYRLYVNEINLHGMHYAVVSGYNIGTSVINLTKDSLEVDQLKNCVPYVSTSMVNKREFPTRDSLLSFIRKSVKNDN